MRIEALRTHKIAVGESIESIFDQHVTNLESGSILAITSKVISLCQGRVVQKSAIDKMTLIKQEADYVLNSYNQYGIAITIKDGILIPNAGIDESNSNGTYILYPENVQKTAQSIWRYLKNKFSIGNLGVIITDSHSTPMRCGVTGIALGWWGFEPLYSYVDKPDIYKNNLQFTHTNIVDALATSAVFVMGEGDEQTPIAVIHNAPRISFVNYQTQEKQNVSISMDRDLYAPLLKSVNWEKN